jgi:hypothetical protein
MVCNSPVYFYPLRYRRSILTAVMLGSLLPGYRVAGNGPHNNRRLALWSRYNSAMGSYVNILVNAFNSVKQLIMRHYCVNITIDLVFESHTPAVYFYRRYESTADSFKSLDVSFFNLPYC